MKNINKILLAASVLLLFANCEENSQQDQQLEDASPAVDSTSMVEEESQPAIDLEEAPVDYFSVCKNLELWKGGIQGVESSDSTGPYIMGQCFGNEHFDIIVYTEEDVELSEAIVNHNDLSKTIPDARYYAFVIPKVAKEDPEDEFDLYDYVYPSDVKVYKMMEGNWYLVKTEEVTSFEELGQLKLKSIYL